MKVIRIEIQEDLTPMHQDILLSTIYGTLKGMKFFWNSRSKKFFDVKIDNLEMESWKRFNNVN